MAVNTRTVHASTEEVWEVIANGWLYPLWVVGASRIRTVDETWPAKGSRIHHSVGVWPLMSDDHTEVVECTPGHRLRLLARAWPLGEADVVLTVTPVDEDCEIRIVEDSVSGPGRLLPGPVRGLPLTWRNVETLRRLAFLVEGRAGRGEP